MDLKNDPPRHRRRRRYQASAGCCRRRKRRSLAEEPGTGRRGAPQFRLSLPRKARALPMRKSADTACARRSTKMIATTNNLDGDSATTATVLVRAIYAEASGSPVEATIPRSYAAASRRYRGDAHASIVDGLRSRTGDHQGPGQLAAAMARGDRDPSATPSLHALKLASNQRYDRDRRRGPRHVRTGSDRRREENAGGVDAAPSWCASAPTSEEQRRQRRRALERVTCPGSTPPRHAEDRGRRRRIPPRAIRARRGVPETIATSAWWRLFTVPGPRSAGSPPAEPTARP
jgi:hypothetical protein